MTGGARLTIVACVLVAARANGNEPPCSAPLPTVDAIGQCLGASLRNPGPWSVLATTPSARLVRAGNPQGPEVFVVARRGSGWAAVAAVNFEHGHAEVRAGTASETSIGAQVVARFEVHGEDAVDTRVARDPDALDTVAVASERSIFCVIGGRCLIVTTDCQATHTITKRERTITDEKGQFAGHVQLGADGVVTLTTEALHDPARLCERPAATQRLWTEPAADAPRWTPLRVCTVVAPRAYFRDPLALTPLRACVLKGDRVEVSARGDEDANYVVARYQGAQKLTIGVLEAKSLACAAK